MIKEKIKNKFYIIDVMLLIFILIASILCREDNFFLRLIQIFINIIMLVYYLYRIKINQNVELINTRLDIFVFLLVIKYLFKKLYVFSKDKYVIITKIANINNKIVIKIKR